MRSNGKKKTTKKQKTTTTKKKVDKKKSASKEQHYCAFDIFQEVVFCLTIYTEEVNLQNFVMI